MMDEINRLLTKYVDAINNGDHINISNLINECSIENREELKQLIETIKIFKSSNEVQRVRPEIVKVLFENLDNQRIKKFGKTDNFKKASISDNGSDK